MILSASRKFLNSAATIKSDLYNRWKSDRGKVVHAIVSVMEVKIQLSSPRGVRRSLGSPGILGIIATVTGVGSWWFIMKYRRAMSMGDVRQAVKRSAGSSGHMGSCSSARQAAIWILSI